MTNDPIAEVARRAGGNLAAEYGSRLTVEVETALHTRESEHRPEQYFDPVSLGSLIVSVASLAWTVYTGLKQKTPKPSAEVLSRVVRVELSTRDNALPAPVEKITDVVVTQIIRVTGNAS